MVEVIRNSFYNFLAIAVIIIILLSSIPINIVSGSEQGVSNSTTNNQPNLKLNDYVEYNLQVIGENGIDQYGYPTGSYSFFKPEKTGYFRWTVIGVNESKLTLKIELSIDSFYSSTKQIIVSNGLLNDSNNKTLGYNPFWISLDNIEKNQSEIINLGGTQKAPLVGKLLTSNEQIEIAGEYRDVYIFTNTENYFTPGTSGQNNGSFRISYSKYNGLLVDLGLDSSDLSIMFQYSYIFQWTTVLTKTNINFGPINYGYTLLTIMAPLWIPIIIIMVIGLAILGSKGRKRL